jgi:hypothetical protein
MIAVEKVNIVLSSTSAMSVMQLSKNTPFASFSFSMGNYMQSFIVKKKKLYAELDVQNNRTLVPKAVMS